MKYYLIDLANIPAEVVPVVNQAFALWKESYKAELEMRDLKLNEDVFWNSRLLAVIKDEEHNKIIGSHLYNVFDIRTVIEKSHHYFEDFSEENIRSFRMQGATRLMSMEYLLVNPQYRGKNSPVRWGEVVIGLGLQVMKNSPWGAIFGIARADKKVDGMLKKMGCLDAGEVIKNQTPCRVVFMQSKDLKPHQDAMTQNIIDQLWKSKFSNSPWQIITPERPREQAPPIHAA